MSFAQGPPTQPLSLVASNVFVTGNSAVGNAFTVQQLGAGNVASFLTSTGVPSLFINTSGNVGLGTTNPSYLVDVNGILRSTSNIFLGAGGTGGTGMTIDSISTYQRIQSWNSLPLVLNPLGNNVGIGTTSAGATLQVYASGTTSPLSVVTASNTAYAFITTAGQSIGAGVGATQPQIQTYQQATNNIYLNFFGYRQTAGSNWTGIAQRIQHQVDTTPMGYIDFNPGSSSQGLAFGNGSTEYMRIASTGYVSIGTTSAFDLFTIYNSQGTNRIASFNNTYNSGGANQTVFVHTDQSFSVSTTSYTGSAFMCTTYPNNVSGNQGYTAYFGTSDGAVGSLAPQMVIKAATGYVGIGTATPSKPLHVWGGMIIGASSDSRATTVTLNAPGATVTFSQNADIGDAARIMTLQCPDLSSTTANLVSFSLQVAPTGTFGSQRTSLDLKGFRVASQSYGGFCITSPFDTAGSYDLFYTDRTKAYFQQNVGIGTVTPAYKLHVSNGDSSYAYFGPNVTWGAYLKIGCGTSYATTSTASINVSNGNLHIDAASTSSYSIYLNYFNSGGNGANYGQTNSYGTFYNNGAGLFTGDVTAFYSDERLKTKTGTLSGALDKVCSLDTFTYVPNELAKSIGYTDEKERLGLSAQQVQKVAPQVVSPAPIDLHESGPNRGKSKSGNDYLTVQYDKLVPLLVEALKEERAERLRLQDRLERLEKLLSQDHTQ